MAKDRRDDSGRAAWHEKTFCVGWAVENAAIRVNYILQMSQVRCDDRPCPLCTVTTFIDEPESLARIGTGVSLRRLGRSVCANQCDDKSLETVFRIRSSTRRSALTGRPAITQRSVT